MAKALQGDRVTGVVAEFLAAITFGLGQTIESCAHKQGAPARDRMALLSIPWQCKPLFMALQYWQPVCTAVLCKAQLS